MYFGCTVLVIFIAHAFQTKATHCDPQTTPKYGEKWCNFTLSANEQGSRCKFSCNPGFYLDGHAANECVEHIWLNNERGYRFQPDHGECLPYPRPLQEGSNGPFTIVSKETGTVWGIEGSRLVDRETWTSFYISKPGLTQDHGTVSIFTIVDKTPNYVIINDRELNVHPEPTSPLLSMEFMLKSTFLFRQDYFFPGFASFESNMGNGQFIVSNTMDVIMGEPYGKQTQKKASFKWIRPRKLW